MPQVRGIHPSAKQNQQTVRLALEPCPAPVTYPLSSSYPQSDFTCYSREMHTPWMDLELQMINFPLPENLKSIKYHCPSGDFNKYVQIAPTHSTSAGFLTSWSRARSVLSVQTHMVTNCINSGLYIPLKESHDQKSRYPQAGPAPAPAVTSQKSAPAKKSRTKSHAKSSAKDIGRLPADQHRARAVGLYAGLVDTIGGGGLINLALKVRLCSPFATRARLLISMI